MAGTVFISHANEDKPRIGELIKALLDAGFSLFIDHPEKIESIPLDLIDGKTIRSLADIRNGQTTGYQDQLDAELRNADCVLGVLSENITAENSVLLGEFDVARYEGNLILCSIARPSFKLPSRLAAYNVNTLDRERHGNVIVERSLKLLIKQVRALIDGRQRNRQTGGQTAPPPAASDAYRVLHDLAPLRIGRSNQVDLLSLLVDDCAGAVKPALLVGPRNELPSRLPECLSRDLGANGGSGGSGATNVIPVEWPANMGANFQRIYLRRLSKQVSGIREDMSCAEIATAIANKGHRQIVYSNLAHADGKYRLADIEAWANFWLTRWPAEAAPALQGGLAPKIMPLLNLVLKDAEPGWDQSAPNLPPTDADADGARLRAVHAEVVSAVRRALTLDDGTEVIANPVRVIDFGEWVTALDERLLGSRDRAELRRLGEAKFGIPPRDEGVPLELLHGFASDWLKNSAA